MKKYIYPLAITATLLAAPSCSDDEVNAVDQPIPDSQKEMISFSLSDGAASTRAGFTGSATHLVMRIQGNEKGNTTNAKYTRTVATAAVGGSGVDDYSDVTFNTSDKRYWDDAFGRKSLLSVYAVAIPNGGNSLKNNEKTLEELINSGLNTGETTWGTDDTNTIAWQVTTGTQTKDAPDANTPTKTIDLEDLVYSNNIKSGGKNGIYRYPYPENNGRSNGHKDGQMLFYQDGMTDTDAATKDLTSAPGHFDRGHLVFNHALSRMTITLVEGEGFTAGVGSDFKFKTATENIKLLNMYVKGTLNIATGTWTINKTAGSTNDNVKNIDVLAKTTDQTDASGTYVAQMLPEYVFTNGDDTNVMEFTIDGNTYYVTQDMLFDALTYDKNGNNSYDANDGDGMLAGATGPISMEQGKNYNFSITVNKTAIAAITATLTPWAEVKGSLSMNNSHVTFDLYSASGTVCSEGFQFYRLAETLTAPVTKPTDNYTATNYSGDYKTEGAATTSTMAAPNASKYQTDWYYKDNSTAYHFRTLNALAANSKDSEGNSVKDGNIQNTTDSKSYFTMTAGTDSPDYHWGAPMKKETSAGAGDGATLKYDVDKGYESSLHQGIVATESDIKITELHMMSNLNIVLETTTGTDKVDLSAGTTVTITRLATTATVDMGTGLITPSSTVDGSVPTKAPGSSDYWETESPMTKPFTCSVIPQALNRHTGDGAATTAELVGITITTKDGNTYYVEADLSKITASVVGAQAGQQHVQDEAIVRWYPNHTYTYTFKLSKTKIENITASVAQWVTVTAGSTDINLEN